MEKLDGREKPGQNAWQKTWAENQEGRGVGRIDALVSRGIVDDHFMTNVAGGQHAPKKCCLCSSTARVRSPQTPGSQRFS